MKLKSVLLSALMAAGVAGAVNAQSITVYSARNEQLIKPLFDAFTKETGIEIKLMSDKAGPLMERLKAEGANTPADVFITVDAGNLWQAASQGLLRPIKSAALERNIPAHLRDPKGEWYGLSVRARTIMHNPAVVPAAQLSTYADLADPKWKGKLCLRTSKSVYNQSLVATMIEELGEKRTEQIVRGWVANLATDPFSDDTSLIKAIAAGQCQVGVANTYYLGRLLDKDAKFPVTVFWANQKEQGTHVNVSGAGVTRYAKSPALAQRLIEWLSSDKAQFIYTDKDMEYPANPAIQADSVIKGWGNFKRDPLNVSKAGELQGRATQLMDRAGYR